MAPIARLAVAAVIIASVLGAAAPAAEGEGAASALELYRKRDFFTLRERLDAVSGWNPAAPPETRFLVAALHHAFNRPLDSNALLVALEQSGALPPELAAEGHRLRLANHLRGSEFPAALAAARSILEAPAGALPSKLVSDTRNTALLLAALASVPPQRVDLAGTARLALRNDRRVPIAIGDVELRLAIDTGANFSVLMRSEARRAGLPIRPVGLQVATSTGRSVPADVAVAERVTLGTATYRNVVFLVFPDQLLNFPDGTRIPGLIGFPMLEGLGEIRFRSDNTLEIPGRPARRRQANLALDDHELLIRTRVLGGDLLCRLDTGANRTFFYAPFFRRFRERIQTLGELRKVEVGGVGGLREIEAYRVSSLTLTLARADVKLRDTDVYTAPLVEGKEEHLDCNVGLDALRGFRAYTINLRDLALVLD